jgi:integrase
MADAGNPRIAQQPLTVRGLIAEWLEAHPSRDNGYRIANLDAFAGTTTLDDLAPDVLVKLERHIRRRLAPKTVIDRIRTASACLRWGVSQGWIRGEFTVPRMRKPVRQARDVEPDECAKVLSSLPVLAGRLLRFIAAVGCRPKEARMLRWSQVSLRSGVCILGKHKTAGQTGEVRTIYLTPAAVAVLNEIQPREGYVFPSRLDRPYSASGLRSILRRHGEGITPYALRHTFAQVVSEELAEQDLAKLMGHRDVATTRHYYTVKDKRARSLASMLSLPQIAPAHLESPAEKPASAKHRRRRSPSPRKAKTKARGAGPAVRRRA